MLSEGRDAQKRFVIALVEEAEIMMAMAVANGCDKGVTALLRPRALAQLLNIDTQNSKKIIKYKAINVHRTSDVAILVNDER